MEKNSDKVWFEANRWDFCSNKSGDTYEVLLDRCNRDWPTTREKNTLLIETYSADIRDALLNFPAGQRFDYIQPNKVVFKANGEFLKI